MLMNYTFPLFHIFFNTQKSHKICLIGSCQLSHGAVFNIVSCFPPNSGSALDFQPPAPSLYGGSSLVTCPLYRGRSATNSAWTTSIVLLKDTSAGWLLCCDGGLKPGWAWWTVYLKKQLSIQFGCWTKTIFRCNIVGYGADIVCQKNYFALKWFEYQGKQSGNL